MRGKWLRSYSLPRVRGLGRGRSWANDEGFERKPSNDDAERAETMNLPLRCRAAMAALLGTALVGCAGPAPNAAPSVVRTPPPVGYEKTITNYLAFRIRGPQKNAELSVSAPEPGPCALDGYAAGRRGWVVPVVYATRTGEATGRETIRINTKQYYFWFLGNTIAGVSSRLETCPGIEASFADVPPSGAAAVLQPVVLPVSTPVEAARGAPAEGDAARGRAQESSAKVANKKRAPSRSSKSSRTHRPAPKAASTPADAVAPTR